MELSVSHLKSQKTLWRLVYMFALKNQKFEHIGESSPNTPIIHAFNLAQKRFFKPVNSQKPLSEWSTCRPLATRFLAVYWLKKSLLSKFKGMNNRGIRRTFPYVLEFLVQTPIFKKFVRMVYKSEWSSCRPFSTRFFLLLKWKRLNSEGYAYYPWAGH